DHLTLPSSPTRRSSDLNHDHAGTLGHRARPLPRGAAPPRRLFLAPQGPPTCSAIARSAAAGLLTRQKYQRDPTCPAWHEPAPPLLHLSPNSTCHQSRQGVGHDKKTENT